MPSGVSAVVLAAGMSSRMGTLKQLVKIGDQTLLETTLRAVYASRARETILVLGYQADTISKKVSIPVTTKLVHNEDYEKGMSASIRVGIQSVAPDSSAALIVLADQPFLKASIIDKLIEEYEKSHSPIVIPVYKGFRGNPVLIDRSLFPEMMQISGDIGCRSLFGLHADQILKVTVDDIGILIDIDTARDLSKLESYNVNENQSADILKSLEVEDRSVETKHLLIVGEDEIAQALTKLGRLLKFAVTVIDPLAGQKDFPNAGRILNELDLSLAGVSASTAIVVASRGRFDEEALQQAIATGASYIALVGSRKRGTELIQRLRANHVPDESLQRIRCPAGLEIHASTPQEIALSIMAQIVQIQNSDSKEQR